MLYSFLTPESIDDSGLSFWQSHTWKRILEDSHQAEEVFYFGNTLGTFFLVEVRTLKLGMLGAFVLGPNTIQIQSDFALCIEALKGELKKKE